MSVARDAEKNSRLTGPYDSLRDFVHAIEARGKLMRLKEIDQDRYEATGVMYRLIDKYGYEDAPALLIERMKIDGKWRNGPVVANLYGNWDIEALPWGVEDIGDNDEQMYRATRDKLMTRIDQAGNWMKIKPVHVEPDHAPCKEVRLTGDDIDLLKFPWLKNNPADAARYINTGAVFMHDSRLGSNVGTYRCQIKGKNKIGLNPEPGQDGWRLLMGMKRRGDRACRVSIAVAVDPAVWSVSSTKMAGFGESEIEIAGGLIGKPIELVRSETNDIMVPAHAEMIIEGEVPLDQAEDEGPYGEMYGYLGLKKRNNFFVNITAVTHRRNPMFFNSFTGVAADMPKGPSCAAEYHRYRKLIPGLKAIYTPRGANGVSLVSIDKRFPGEGMVAGQAVAANPGLNKVVIVVDKDVNILKPLNILHVLGARWQPSASVVIPQTQMRMPDPSMQTSGITSKMIIDATQQLPGEGGPDIWPPVSRVLLEEKCPDLLDEIDRKWPDYLAGWMK